jgi:hypothetical protein
MMFTLLGMGTMLRSLAVAAAVILLGCLHAAQAEAGVVITVDKTVQRLSVAVDGQPRYNWPVSTARWGYRTPNGVYHPQRLARQWYSRKYDWSPMPYSIFFDGGYAIHGSYEISRLGRPASHGCIRLHPSHAAVLFALVQANRGNTRIVITGAGPSAAPLVARRHRVAPSARAKHAHTWRLAHTRRRVHARHSFEEVFSVSRSEPVYRTYDDRPAYRRW